MQSSKLIVLICLVEFVLGHYIKQRISYSPSIFSNVPKGRIAGGTEAKKGQFPHQVSLHVTETENTHFCDGSILHSEWVLTAAHCLPPSKEDITIFVKAGKYQLNSIEDTEQVAEVKSIIIHDKYTGEAAPYDIALLKLKNPLILSKDVAPINLPSPGAEPTGTVVFSGWGSMSTTNSAVMPNILQMAELPIVDFKTCHKAVFDLEGVSPLHETNVCTGPLTGGVAACSGDSGGPLIAYKSKNNVEVVGIASWGIFPCGTVGAPSVYTKVSSYTDWIRDTIAAN